MPKSVSLVSPGMSHPSESDYFLSWTICSIYTESIMYRSGIDSRFDMCISGGRSSIVSSETVNQYMVTWEPYGAMCTDSGLFW